MHRIHIVAVAAVCLGGCAAMGASTDRAKLVSTASFDHRCPEQKIAIVSEKDDGFGGTGQYELEVCGQVRRYKRAGTLYYDAETGGPLGK
jgi:hypothetical protein